MEALYHLPAERFAHLTAAGRPADVADVVAPYVEAGASSITVIPVAADPLEGIALAGEVASLLRG